MTRLYGGIFAVLFVCAAAISACGGSGSPPAIPAPLSARQKPAPSTSSASSATIVVAVVASVRKSAGEQDGGVGRDLSLDVAVDHGARRSLALAPNMSGCVLRDGGKSLVCATSFPAGAGDASIVLSLRRGSGSKARVLSTATFARTARKGSDNGIIVTLEGTTLSVSSGSLPVPMDSPLPSDTPSPAPTDTPSPSVSDSPSPGPTDSPSPSPSPSDAPSPTPSPSDTPSPSPSPTDTPSPTPSPTDTPSPSPSPTDSPSPTPTPSPAATIAHVIVVVQENRTFDNLFNGFPGADTAQTGLDHTGGARTLVPAPLLGSGDWSHTPAHCTAAYDGGKMDGFDLDAAKGAPPSNYSYVQQSDVSVYWTLASAYALADRMFQSNCGASFPAHQFLIAAQSGSMRTPHVAPWGCDSQMKQPPCFDYQTLGDELDVAGLSWRYYAHGTDINTPAQYNGFLAYDAIRHIRYGPDWTTSHIGIPESTVLADIQRNALPAVTWVTTTCSNSDHHKCGVGKQLPGPAWVGSIVDAVGQSPYWSNTAVLILWDDWGGWYDHVAPPILSGGPIGFRVPLIVVSPYARHGYVSHVNHTFGSVVRFVEQTFNLGYLNQQDIESDDLSDCFDFTQQVQPFHRINVPPLRSDPFDTQPADDDL